MKNYQKLVWKLIDRNISDREFKQLQIELSSDVKLRDYYQQCLEAESTLGNRHHTPFLTFTEKSKATSNKIISFFTYSGWAAAAAVLFLAFFKSPDRPSARLVSVKNADWRGMALEVGQPIPRKMLHLQKGAVEIDFSSNTKVVVEAPAYFQITDEGTMVLGKGKITATHQGDKGTFKVETPVGSIVDLGTQFGVFVDHSQHQSTIITKVFEGNIKFLGNSGTNRFFNNGESAIIRGTNTGNGVKILVNHPYAQLNPLPTLSGKQDQIPESINYRKNLDDEINKSSPEEFDAVDLMLQGNISAQINYSMVKGIADALDQKVQILQNAQHQYTPLDEVTFAEAAMLEIEAMARSIVDSYVEFSKIRYWEACQTAEITWDEKKDQNGQITHRIPHAQRLAQPREGNRLLKNLEQIREWISKVHLIHEEKGMGWASQFGCPEDGKAIFDKRNKKLLAITYAIDSIKSNLD